MNKFKIAIFTLNFSFLALLLVLAHAQTAPNACPAGQYFSSVLANVGQGCTALAAVAISDSYTDLIDQPTIPSTTRTTSSASTSLVGSGATGTQISSSKDSTIRLTLSTSTTATIGAASTSVVVIKICSTNSSTEGNWTTVATLESDQNITLAIALQSVQIIKGEVESDVPAGWYYKVENSGTGTHAEAFLSGQQTIYG